MDKKQVTQSESIKYLMEDIKTGIGISLWLGAALGAGLGSIVIAPTPTTKGISLLVSGTFGVSSVVSAKKLVYDKVKEYLDNSNNYMQTYHSLSIK